MSMTDNKPVDDGGAAFPEAIAVGPAGDVYFGPSGMSKRDYFAGQALIGLGTWVPCRDNGSYPTERAEILRLKADWAYATADAMLAARQEQPQ